MLYEVITEVHAGPLTMIYYDTILIRRVLMNLISNAVKYTSEGGRVSVVLEENREEVSVCVSDTGEGIRESEQKHLFKDVITSYSIHYTKLYEV